MDGILNKIINLDNQAKNKIIQIKQKEENIETYISETIEKEKKERSKNVIFYQSTYKSVRLSFHQINKEENIGKLEFNS